MLSVVQQQAVLDRNRVVDAWIEDMLIAHGLPDSHIQGPLLPKPYPSPPTHSNLSSSLPYAIHLPNRPGKRKSPHLLQSTDLNIDPTSSQPPPSPPKRTATKWLGKGRRKEKSDKTEENVQVQGKEAPGPQHTRMTRAASAALSQAESSRSPITEQHGLGSSLFNQVHLPHPVNSNIASAFDANAALISRPRPQPESTTGQPWSLTRKSGTTSKASNARSESLIKSMADLAFADKPIEATEIRNTTLPEDVREMYKRLNALSVNEGVLPTLIKDDIATAAGDVELLRPFMFDSRIAENPCTREQLLRELEELDEIRAESRNCEEIFFPERAWNEAVHYPILKLALKRCAGVKYRNVTTARVVPSLVPRHANGDILQSKIVDYTINLQPNIEMKDMILRLLESQPYDLRTINQTMCDHVRYLPIAISIEAKTPDASAQEAKIQLGMWVAAHFNRLRMLSHENAVLPTLPLLYVSGNWWYLYFARDRARCIELLGQLPIGDTNSVVGCYKLLAALRCLAGWVTTTFKEWLELKVFHPNAV